MARFAYAAVAAAAEVEEGPSDWPDGWTWPPDSSGPWPPSFVTAHADFTTPSPADDALAVDIDADFSWAFAYTIDGVEYEADSFEILMDDVVVGTSSTATFDPGTLEVGDHTWRVIAHIGSNKYVGPEWSFQTEGTLSGEASAVGGAAGHLVDVAMFLSGEAAAVAGAEAAGLTHYQPPQSPSNVEATWGAKYVMNPYYKVIFTWEDNSSNEDGFEAALSTTGVFGAATDAAADATTVETVGGVSGMANYYVGVRSFRTVGGVKVYSGWIQGSQLMAIGPW